MPARLVEAFRRCPRHSFLSRYRRTGDKSWHFLNVGRSDLHLNEIYKDQPLAVTQWPDGRVRSAQTQPSLMARMLNWLEPQSGNKILEIGSGTGWMLAILATLVGPNGHATGIEINGDLARQSRRNLVRAKISNATVLAADGAQAESPRRFYDRIVFTASLPDLPSLCFDQLAPGGKLLAPLRIPGGTDALFLFCRKGLALSAQIGTSAIFVPISGHFDGRDFGTPPLASDPRWPHLRERRQICEELWEPRWRAENMVEATAAFRSYLWITEPWFSSVTLGFPGAPLSGSNLAFGLMDPHGRSAAYITRTGTFAFGSADCHEKLRQSLFRWREIGRPGATDFSLKIYPAGKSPRKGRGWRMSRGGADLIWSIKR
jgi:protein-L-isoaspartate(D-aspartate) O-methyltransferase